MGVTQWPPSPGGTNSSDASIMFTSKAWWGREKKQGGSGGGGGRQRLLVAPSPIRSLLRGTYDQGSCSEQIVDCHEIFCLSVFTVPRC